MPAKEKVWSCSIRYSFRYYPETDQVTGVFLDSHGRSEGDILRALPYSAKRSQTESEEERSHPNARRLRDPRMVYEQIGLLERSEGDVVSLSPLGKALSSWRACINDGNLEVIGAHVAGSLAACQLRNPTRLGSKYDEALQVFPMAFIWKAMLELDNRIYSDELNREILRLTSADEISDVVQRIRAHRANPAIRLREETEMGPSKNDRIIPWMAMASCGWLLMTDKRTGKKDYYEIRSSCTDVIRSAILSLGIHTEFPDVPSYLERIHSSAMLHNR